MIVSRHCYELPARGVRAKFEGMRKKTVSLKRQCLPSLNQAERCYKARNKLRRTFDKHSNAFVTKRAP